MTEISSASIDNAPSTQLTPESNPANPTSFKPEALEPEKEVAKPLTARQALEKAAAEANAVKEEPKSDKPKVEVKAEPEKVEAKPAQPRENGKFVSANPEQKSSEPTSEVKGAGQDGGEDIRPSEGRDHHAPPARFLPRAKEQWANVPDDVKGEVHRALSEMEKGMGEYKESHEFRKELKPFEEMAKANKITVRQALENYTNIDRQLRENPVEGLERIFQSIGIDPIKYAQHILGQAHAAQQNPALAETQQLQRQIQQLTQQIQSMQQSTVQERQQAQQNSAYQDVERNIITPFKASHPRYEELQGDIAFFLNSDKIPSNLSAQSRLETAYDMAERINPAPLSDKRLNTSQPQKPLNPAGEKSIKGAPGASDNVTGDKGKMKTRDSIRAAAAELGIQL